MRGKKESLEKISTKALEKQLEVVEDVSQKIAGHIDLNEVLRVVLNQLVQGIGYTFSGLFLLNSKNNELTLTEVGAPPAVRTIFDKAVGGSVLGVSYDINDKSDQECYVVKALLDGKVYESQDLKNFSTRRYLSLTQAKLVEKLTGIKLFVTIPVVLKGKPIGTLIVATRRSELVERDVRVLKTFASQISIAIYNAQLFSRVQTQVIELKEQADDLEALHDLSTFAESTLEKDSVAQDLMNIVPKKLGHLGVVGSALFMRHGDDEIKVKGLTQGVLANKLVQVVVKKQIDRVYEPMKIPDLMSDVFTNNKIVILDELNALFPSVVKKRMEKAMKKLGGITFYAIVPVIQQGVAIGGVLFAFSIPQTSYDERHREILRVFSNHVAIALDNANLYRQLQDKLVELEKQSEELRVANVQLQALDDAKSEFISIASHQLRTPLTVIKGYLSLIEEGSIDGCSGPAMDTVKKVSQSSDRLVALVNDLLDVSRIERGKMVIEKKKAYLEDIAKSVFDELSLNAKEKGLDFEFTPPTRSTGHVEVDISKLRQVMLNLIDNAIKYTPSGIINVSVKYQNGNVFFIVKDTGIGMMPNEIDSLFKKFVRGEDVSTMHTEGIGLGLFVAKKIMDAHDGRIWAESEGKGKGSTFAFSLPVIKKNGKKSKK